MCIGGVELRATAILTGRDPPETEKACVCLFGSESVRWRREGTCFIVVLQFAGTSVED